MTASDDVKVKAEYCCPAIKVAVKFPLADIHDNKLMMRLGFHESVVPVI